MSKTKLFRKDGSISFGMAWILFFIGVILYNYGDYVIALGICLLIAYLIYRQFKKPSVNHITISQIDSMTGDEFEEYLVNLFKVKGYRAYRTRCGADQGADIILDEKYSRTVVQAKRYNKKVSNSAVQEVVASVKYYNANRAMVITNSDFTKPAIDLARVNNVELIGRSELKKLMIG